ELEEVPAHQAPALLRQAQVDADDVALPEEVVESQPDDAGGGGAVGGEGGAPGEDAHAEQTAEGGHARADPAEAEDAEGLAAELDADALLPAPVPQRPILLRDPTDDRQEEADRVLGRRGDAALGSGHEDPSPGGRVHVHVAGVAAGHGEMP